MTDFQNLQMCKGYLSLDNMGVFFQLCSSNAAVNVTNYINVCNIMIVLNYVGKCGGLVVDSFKN